MICAIIMTLGLAYAEPVVETLDNGCRVIVEEDHSRPVAALRVYVGVGSALEGQWLGAGVSHFVEHTIDEGTPTRTSEDISRLVESMGNNSNAYTTRDDTCYYITTTGGMIGEAIDLYADFVLDATFPDKEVETQRGIIQREMAMGDDEPGRIIYAMFAETMFLRHPHRYRIIGYPEAFNAVTRDDLARFHRLWYVPDNIVVVVVGDVDGKNVLRQLRERFGAAPRRAAPAVELQSEPEQIAPRRRVRVKEGLGRAYLQMGWPTVNIFHEDLYPLDVLAYYLTAGDSSPMVARLRDELGLVDGVSCHSITPWYEAGHFMFSATLDPDNLDEAEAAIVEAVQRVADHPPGREDLARVQRQMAVAEVYGQESAEDRAASLGSNLITTGDAFFSERYLEGIAQVTPAQIKRVIGKYFQPERLSVAILSPTKPRGPRDDGGARGGQAATVVRKLDNGLTVVVRESHALPLVSISTATLGGLRYETPEDAGITSLMASMLVRGAAGRTREQIASSVDRVGGSLEPYSGRNSFGVNASFMAEDLPLALGLVADVWLRPTFPEDELAAQKRLTLAGIQARGDSVESFAFEALLGDLYTAHPYGRMPSGTVESVEALTREDLADFHRRFATVNGSVLTVCGDVDAEDVIARVAELMRTAPAHAQEPPTPPVEPPIEQRRERTIARSQGQAIVAYGFHGLSVTDPDQPALDVLDAAFSGVGFPGGRLHDALRGQQLVYFAHAMPIGGVDPGPFVIYAGTQADKVEIVRSEIERLVAEVVSEPISDEELTRARAMCISSELVGLQTNGALAQTMALDTLYGLGPDRWEGYAARIEAVTAGDVLAVAKRVLDLNRSVVVVTTPEAE
jgi:zinc protease